MFQTLPQGIKISISRSIKTAFEQYMKDINWVEDKFDFPEFVQFWRDFSKKNASWFEKVDDEIKRNPNFHEELTQKINETIEKILTTPPSQDEMDKIDNLVRELEIEDVDYSCKAEAKFHIDRLDSKLKKKQ
jgi:hypothetical protein